MPDPVEVVFPWSLYVSANERLIPRGDRLVSSSAYRNRMEAARLVAQNQTTDMTFGTEPVRMVQHIYPPDKRRRDVRNVGKLFEDALEGVLYEDDYQIRDLRMVYHAVDRDDPRIVVTVERMEEKAA